MDRIYVFLLFMVFLINENGIVNGKNRQHPPILCRPDQVYESEIQKCVRLKYSISSLVKDILDSSDSSIPFLHYTPETLMRGLNATLIPSKVQVSDLFIQNLAFINEANMTDCIAMAACNEHCYSWPERTNEQKKHEMAIIEKLLGLTETTKKEDEEEAPDFVRIIMQASKKGIDLAKKYVIQIQNHQHNNNKQYRHNICFECQKEHQSHCGPMNYAYTVRINALYRKLIENNVTFVNMAPKLPQNLSPEMLYYHYSMHFVQRANLTNCYALVSCENTCHLYKTTIAELGANAIEPPNSESILMRGDPNKPESIDIIHHASLIGYKLAADDHGHCDECSEQYPNCSDDKYEIAKASAAIFGN